MVLFIGLAVGLIVAGLIICYLSGSGGRAAGVFWWVGIILAVVGLVLLIAPVISWVAAQLRVMLGVP